MINLNTAVAISIVAVEKYGFIKSGELGATKGLVSAVFEQYKEQRSLRMLKVNEVLDTYGDNKDEYAEMARDIVAWVRNQYAKSDYVRNLQKAFSKESINVKQLGYVTAAVNSYITEKEKANKAAKTSSSDFVGEVGSRITLTVTKVRILYDGMHHLGYHSQPWVMYRMVDEAGNIYLWKSSSIGFDLEEFEGLYDGNGTRATVTGTIKEHKEYKGERQTVLTRCKVSSIA